MLILFNNSFPRLIKSSERLIKTSERLNMSFPRVNKSSERLINSWERLINSCERLIVCRRNDLLTRRNDLLCCNASLSHSPTGTECPRPHQACNESTPVHLVISTAESLRHTSCDAQATAPEPHEDFWPGCTQTGILSYSSLTRVLKHMGCTCGSETYHKSRSLTFGLK